MKHRFDLTEKVCPSAHTDIQFTVRQNTGNKLSSGKNPNQNFLWKSVDLTFIIFPSTESLFAAALKSEPPLEIFWFNFSESFFHTQINIWLVNNSNWFQFVLNGVCYTLKFCTSLYISENQSLFHFHCSFCSTGQLLVETWYYCTHTGLQLPEIPL